jgi:mono/diheme cytochrome c family protein
MKRRSWMAMLGGLSALVVIASAVAVARARADEGKVARGKKLVALGGCNDCHTPLKMGPNGPEPDLARLLSGHPAELKMPPAPVLPAGPWAVTASATLTAWSGPWGVSFSRNLTPDPETGLGRWTERDFVDTIRTGRHMGRGRAILPPMPVQSMSAALGDDDLAAMFAYLRSIPAVRNEVPDPIAPETAAR